MANQFTDMTIVECNRLHSEEAQVGNDQNYSLWTNNLADIVHLEPGDTVSMKAAMISERGAGQPSSIEIKGESLGFAKEFRHTILEKTVANDDLATEFEVYTTIEQRPTYEIRDDTAYFTLSYYISMNGHNYFQAPRRWWNDQNQGDDAAQWTTPDGLTFGLPLWRANAGEDNYVLEDDFYQIIPQGYDYTVSGSKQYKLKNNNDRYYLMMRDRSYYSKGQAEGFLPEYGLRDPENAYYYAYKELKTLTVPRGFNSPEYISTELTEQLQRITRDKTWDFRHPDDKIQNASSTGFPIPMFKTIETETYKAFDVAYEYSSRLNVSSVENNFLEYINASGVAAGANASGFEWLSQYHLIATKRPELYRTGVAINVDTDLPGSVGGIQGTYLGNPGTGSYYDIQTEYTKVNVDNFKAFIDSQKLYPEIFDMFNDPRTTYAPGDTIDNCRWFHMNRYANASMTLNANASDAQLGWGGYQLHSWQPAVTGDQKQVSSIIVPYTFDPEQSEIFYEEPNPYIGQYSYGCFQVWNDTTTDPGITIKRIRLRTSPFNGRIDSALYANLKRGLTPPSVIEKGRKCGFDQHFTAPGMAYCVPYAGYVRTGQSYTAESKTSEFTQATAPSAANNETYQYELDSTRYKNKLYIGADAPKINYDGTHFTISALHTAFNKSNSNYASNLNVSGDTLPGEPDPDADIEVYFINPREQWNDYTPARQPYIGNFKNASGRVRPGFNSNLESWRVYDSLCGTAIEEFNLTRKEWRGTLWELLGFSYEQFHSTENTRNKRVDYDNANSLSVITTNAQINEGDTKIYVQNLWGVPLYTNMLPTGGKLTVGGVNYLPEIAQKTTSISIIADNMPTRMIRGYYTIRSNIIQEAGFIGGKTNNVPLPIIAIVDKRNPDGDFYFGEESSMEYTITRPLRLASLTTSIHDPDGSYANTSEQNTVLFKIRRQRTVTFDIAAEMLAEQQAKK